MKSEAILKRAQYPEIKKEIIRNTREVNQYLTQLITLNRLNEVTIQVDKQDSIAVGIDKRVRITAEGNAGDFFGALNNGATIVLKGDSDRFAANVMSRGEVIIHGNCGEGTGMYMYGGHVIVYGNAGDHLGQISKGGTIIVTGDAGDLAGLYLTGGDIVVLNNIGEKTGEWMIKGRIFVGGSIASLGHNAETQELNNDDRKFLETLYREDIEFHIDGMKKIVPTQLRPFYKKR